MAAWGLGHSRWSCSSPRGILVHLSSIDWAAAEVSSAVLEAEVQ